MSWGVHDLSAGYGGAAAVTGVTVEVAPGDVVVLVGGDGAGKTTVLRVLAGALSPLTGSVERPDVERIGYMPSSSGVYPDLTVMENLAFVAGAFRVKGRQLQRAAEALLEDTGLTAARDRIAAKLSGGMRQKLALAMTLVHEPELLVLDEPTTGVDPVSRAELWKLMARSAARGAGILLATTYLDEAERASHLVVLEDGRPLATGAPNEVLEAFPGALFETDAQPEELAAWRRGRSWRVWSPAERTPPGGRRIAPDLEDAVVVAALGRRAATGGGV